MPHKDSDNLTIAPATRRLPRRVARPLHFESDTMQRKPQAQPQADAKRRGGDFVYAVKVEVRSPDTGHPLVEPSTLAVDELYSNEQKAIDKMQEIVKAALSFEWARSSNNPYSPAWANVVPTIALNSPRLQVITAEGMIHQYFIDEMPVI